MQNQPLQDGDFLPLLRFPPWLAGPGRFREHFDLRVLDSYSFPCVALLDTLWFTLRFATSSY